MKRAKWGVPGGAVFHKLPMRIDITEALLKEPVRKREKLVVDTEGARIASTIIWRCTELVLNINTWSDSLHFVTIFLAKFAKTQTSKRD